MDFLKKTHKIFVDGHNGMVGQAIIRELKKTEYNNILIASRDELDLADEESVKNWFSINKPDIVILAAAKVGGINANNTLPYNFLFENLKIQNNVIHYSWQNNVKRFLFLGSSCIYPKFAEQPIKEESLLSGSLEKTNEWYAIAKIAGIKLCEALYKQYNFDAISLMPTNLYGPGDNYNLEKSHVIPALIRKFYEAKFYKKEFVTCWGTGTVKREFLHVDDLAKACIFVINKFDTKKEISQKSEFTGLKRLLNVGTGQDITIKEISYLISEIIGFDGEIKWDETKPDGTPRKLLDTTRIKSMGWDYKINLENGLRQTINDFEKSFQKKDFRNI